MDTQISNFLSLIMMTSLEVGLHKKCFFPFHILVQAYFQHEFYHPSRWDVFLMEMFTTNSFVFFYMSIMYTKLT